MGPRSPSLVFNRILSFILVIAKECLTKELPIPIVTLRYA